MKKIFRLILSVTLFFALNSCNSSDDSGDYNMSDNHTNQDVTELYFSSETQVRDLFNNVFKRQFQVISSNSPTDENIFNPEGLKSFVFMDQFMNYFTPSTHLIYFEFLYHKVQGDQPFLSVYYDKNGDFLNWIDFVDQKIEWDLPNKQIKGSYLNEKGTYDTFLLNNFKVLETKKEGVQKFDLSFDMTINHSKLIQWHFKNI